MKNNKKSHDDKLILGIPITGTRRPELLRDVLKTVVDSGQMSIFTPNSEIILLAQSDVGFYETMSRSDISIPDSIGVVLASKYLSLDTPSSMLLRIPVCLVQGLCVGVMLVLNEKWITNDLKIIKGREFFLDLIKMANRDKGRVFFLGGEESEAEDVTKIIIKKYKNLSVEYDAGPMFDDNAMPRSAKDMKIEAQVIKKINRLKPNYLFVAASNPKQEKWIGVWLSRLNVNVAMAVGGTFNYVAGHADLPPDTFAMKFEWLWRLIREPRRLKRVFRATVVFPWAVFVHKVKTGS